MHSASTEPSVRTSRDARNVGAGVGTLAAWTTVTCSTRPCGCWPLGVRATRSDAHPISRRRRATRWPPPSSLWPRSSPAIATDEEQRRLVRVVEARAGILPGLIGTGVALLLAYSWVSLGESATAVKHLLERGGGPDLPHLLYVDRGFAFEMLVSAALKAGDVEAADACSTALARSTRFASAHRHSDASASRADSISGSSSRHRSAARRPKSCRHRRSAKTRWAPRYHPRSPTCAAAWPRGTVLRSRDAPSTRPTSAS